MALLKKQTNKPSTRQLETRQDLKVLRNFHELLINSMFFLANISVGRAK